MSGAARTYLVVEYYGNGVARRQEGVVEEVVVAEAWATVDTYQGSDVGFEISEDAIVGLEGLAGCGVVECGEAVV